MHAFLYFRKQIWIQARRSLHEQPDIHARLMSKYPQVPDWWYLCIFLSMFALGVVSIEVWPTYVILLENIQYCIMLMYDYSQMPVWAFILALCISFVYVIPIGMIQAITNQQVGLKYVLDMMVSGTWLTS